MFDLEILYPAFSNGAISSSPVGRSAKLFWARFVFAEVGAYEVLFGVRYLPICRVMRLRVEGGCPLIHDLFVSNILWITRQDFRPLTGHELLHRKS